jgi:hypothetical protein
MPPTGTPPAAITPQGVRDGDPAVLAALAARRGPAVLAFAEEVCDPHYVVRAAADAFARFRAEVADPTANAGVHPDALLLRCARRGALDLATPGPDLGCAPAAPLLLARAERSIKPREAALLKRHLETCEHCADIGDRLDAADRAYREADEVTLDPSTLAPMVAALAAAAPVRMPANGDPAPADRTSRRISPKTPISADEPTPAKDEPAPEPAAEEQPAEDPPSVVADAPDETPEPAKDEPTPEPAEDEPTPEPAKDEPAPEPTAEEQPAENPPSLVADAPDEAPEPAEDEPTPEPAKDEPTPEPAKDEPAPEPTTEEQPAENPPSLVAQAPDEAPEPAEDEPAPEPAKDEPAPEPTTEEQPAENPPTVAADAPDEAPEPAKAEPTPEPADEPEPEPEPVELPSGTRRVTGAPASYYELPPLPPRERGKRAKQAARGAAVAGGAAASLTRKAGAAARKRLERPATPAAEPFTPEPAAPEPEPDTRSWAPVESIEFPAQPPAPEPFSYDPTQPPAPEPFSYDTTPLPEPEQQESAARAAARHYRRLRHSQQKQERKQEALPTDGKPPRLERPLRKTGPHLPLSAHGARDLAVPAGLLVIAVLVIMAVSGVFGGGTETPTTGTSALAPAEVSLVTQSATSISLADAEQIASRAAGTTAP